MTLLAQQAKNRESLLNRLGKGKEMGENGMGTSDDMALRRLQRKSGIDLGASIGPEGIHVSGDPSRTAAITQRHIEQQKAVMAKPSVGTSDDMALRRLQRKSGIDLGATIGPEGIHVSGDPSRTAAITQRHMELQKAAGAKPARPHYYIKGNPAHG
jgi:hypothetical protein